MIRFLAMLGLVCSICASSASADEKSKLIGPLISREEFFARLDYNIPGLAAVKKAVDAQNYDAAARALLDYMRARSNVKFTVDPHGMPAAINAGYNSASADSICKHIPMGTGGGSIVDWFPPYQLGEKIDWAANPYGDREWTWGLNRHYDWLVLADAYWATHNEKYAKEFTDQLVDWVRSCPVVTDGHHNNSASWRTIEAGIRMGHNWPVVYMKFLKSPSFTPEANLLLLMSMVDHARHLVKNPTGGNWLLMERNGLLHVGVLFPEFNESAGWRKLALDTLSEQLQKQVYPDGMQFELSTSYHRVCIWNFLLPLDLCKMNGMDVPKSYESNLEKLYEAEMKLVKPCGYVPALNDADSHIESVPGTGVGSDVRPDLRAGTDRYNRKDLLYAATSGAEGEKPAQDSYAFPYAGLMVMRQGWTPESLYLIFDAGPFGAGHQHEDKLSFEAYAYGETLLFDSGRDAYQNCKYRPYMVSTWAHNTAVVDGKCQARGRQKPEDRKWVAKEPLNTPWVSEKGFDYASGIYDEGYGTDLDKSVTHSRQILFVKNDYWLVVDRFAGSGEHKIDTFFHFAPGKVNADAKTLTCATTNPGRPNLSIYSADTKNVTLSVIEGQETLVQGWISTEYNKRQPAPVADYSYSGRLPADFGYLLYPSHSSGQTRGSVERINVTNNADASAFVVTLDSGAKDYILIAYGVKGVKHFGDFDTDAQIAVVRTDASGKVSKSWAYKSTFVKHGSDTLVHD